MSTSFDEVVAITNHAGTLSRENGSSSWLYRVVFVIAFLILVSGASAQNDAQVTESGAALPVTDDKDSVRRYYIKGFPEYFFLYPVLKQRSLNFKLYQPGSGNLLTYKPNNTFSLGMGMYLFELGVEFAFAIPLREQSIRRFGESNARDLNLNVLAKRWGADVFWQHYSGFYVDDKLNQPLSDEPYLQRPDLVTKNFGLTGYYIFGPQKFSYRSAYNYSERQLFSKGSFLLLGTLYTFRMKGDSSLVTTDRQAQFGPDVGFERLRYTTFGIAPAYSYNLTYNNFFLNTTLGLGPAHHWINYDLEGRRGTLFDLEINTFFATRIAIGYNGYRLFGGISFVSQGSTLRFDDVKFSSNNGVFKVLVGYRFQEVGLLKKRVWDLLPALGIIN